MSVISKNPNPIGSTRAISKLRPNSSPKIPAPSQVTNTNSLHRNSEKKPVIKLGHLQEYFGSTEGETVGKTTLRDNEAGKNIDVNVVRVTNDEGEIYKLVNNNEVIAFREIRIDKGTDAPKDESSLATSVRESSPITGFETDKVPSPKISLEFLASKDPHRYGGILEKFNQIILERSEQIEAKEGIKLKGIQLITSWNSGQSHFNQGLHIQDRTGMDTKSSKKCDKYIQEQIAKAKSAEQANTELLGCTTMYLPWSSRRKWKKEINKNPIFEANNFDKGKVQLTKSDGTKVTAEVTKVHDASTKMDVYKISADGKELGSIQLNPMKVNDQGKVHDYCGDYDKSSPFSQYGNGYMFGWGAKKPRSKLCVEIHETLSNEFTNLNQALFQIPAEIAHKDKGYGGRVMIEADWNEHATLYEIGFRTQKYRGITKAEKLEQAYKTEMEAAKKEGRIANLKQFGSQLMTMPKDEMLEKFKHSQPILSLVTPSSS
jgi:hypothetical protein